MKAAVFTALALFGLSAAAAAQEAAKSYDSFSLLRTRNIFDPDRRAVAKRDTPPPPPGPGKPPGVTLTGTMVADGKMLAFFGSTRSEYAGVKKPSDKIADFTITKITPGLVELERGGKPVMVAVGQPLPIEGAEAFVAGSAPAAPATSPTGTPPADAPAGDKSEVLRRMMERRQKETSP